MASSEVSVVLLGSGPRRVEEIIARDKADDSYEPYQSPFGGAATQDGVNGDGQSVTWLHLAPISSHVQDSACTVLVAAVSASRVVIHA